MAKEEKDKVYITIIAGTYSYHTSDGELDPKSKGEICLVDKNEALRLINLGIAKLTTVEDVKKGA